MYRPVLGHTVSKQPRSSDDTVYVHCTPKQPPIKSQNDRQQKHPADHCGNLDVTLESGQIGAQIVSGKHKHPRPDRLDKDADSQETPPRHARQSSPSIRDDGRRRVLAGDTSLAELVRVTRED